MEQQSAAQESGRSALLQEARKLARQLRACSEESVPQLNALNSDEILARVDLFADLGGQLQLLFSRIESMDTRDEPLAETVECRVLRQEIRTDLDAAAGFTAPCRAALEREMSSIKQELMLTQRKRQISAYIGLPMMGEEDGMSFDRRN
jgi:hypothetical protein